MDAPSPHLSNGDPPPPTDTIVEIDLLIIGTGPAGASLACFLASHGLHGLMISSSSGPSPTPRAHITNPAALECLRDIGLEDECVALATKGDCMTHTRWCRSMAGEEFARIHSWGNDPQRAGDYAAASPCRHVDLPQTLLEPLLLRWAGVRGWRCRFDTAFVGFEREEGGGIVSRLKDTITGATHRVRSKYLFGCDGARSQVLRQLEISLIKKPGQGLAINVLVKVDMSHLMEHRVGNLHWVMTPDEDTPDWAWVSIVRMVKPWHEWMFILFPKPGTGVEFSPSPKDYLTVVNKIIGDETLPVEILDISRWYINEIVAEYYSKDNVFCLGDAVHRHPPINGLGSNTCIQDAYNLSWKVAYTMKGKGGPSLLGTYSKERQPVGHSVITRANQGLRDHVPVWDALGMMDPSLSVRKQQFAELSSATSEGRKRRARLQAAIEGTAHEFLGLGIEMNQRYESSAVYLADEGPRPPLPVDPVLEHQITTYPGSRLPHAWLNTRVPGKQISTIDLAGHGAFCLLTGIGGDAWKEAALSVEKELDVRILCYSIGWCQDYEDVYGDWARRREVKEAGCILIRPDRFVAWRSVKIIENSEGKLLHVMRSILAR
ncbi:hypothetical protein H2201_004888 [Coniosporium apollinis]|uniref:FAD-binding domain-containing protein n=1 Tax=Coniosporium apollinis TaxID=61459 RepID=A0ABQ9NSY0_9PEZI|nr:hypothetical protein H2201_004888 [Coniosporium apollinis]